MIARELINSAGKKFCFDVSSLPELEEGDYYWRQLLVFRFGVFVRQATSNRYIRPSFRYWKNDVLVVTPCEGSVDLVERLIPYKLGDS